MPEYKKINKEPKPPKKPKVKKVPPKTYLFWLRSNRGTDEKIVVELPGDYNKDLVDDTLTEWCSHFAAWTISICSYGWQQIKVPPRPELLKKWEIICKKRNKVQEEWLKIRAMLNVRKM